MGITDALRSRGKTASTVGGAVNAATSKVPDTMPLPIPSDSEEMPTTPAQTAAAQAGFSLPDLGTPPDPNLPEYQTDPGKYEVAKREFEHKQDIHQAFMDLDKIYAEAHPGRDFRKEYEESLADQKAHEAERPKGSSLARAALALGDFNPAVQASGRSNLAEYNQRVGEEGARSDQSFSQRMALKAKMHEQNAAEAAAQGNWKKALREQEVLALLKSDEEGLKHARDIQKEGVKQTAATERAKIRRSAVENSAKIRANSISETHGLTGNFMTQFQKEAAKMIARYLGPRDILKDYDTTDLDAISDRLEALAEIMHDQQFGTEDGGQNHIGTPPGKRTAPKPAGKEEF